MAATLNHVLLKGGPVALLGKLFDLGRTHLDQGKFDRDEKPVDQDEARDDQDFKISHVGRNPVLARVAQAEVERKSRHTRPVGPHQRIGGNRWPASALILTEMRPVGTPEITVYQNHLAVESGTWNS